MADKVSSFDTAITYRPTCLSEQSSDPTIAVAAKLSGQFDHIGNQTILICRAFRDLPLSGAMLPKNPTGPAFRDLELASNMIDASATANGA